MDEKKQKALSPHSNHHKKGVCPLCKGTGFVDRGARVELCKCRFEREDVWKALHIPKRFYQASFDNYKPSSPSQYEALAECYQYSQNFDLGNGKGLSIVGPSGVGKTHLACSVLKEIYVRKGVKGLFFDTRDMLSKLRYYFDDHVMQKRLLNALLHAPLLVLDDLGNETLFDWSREYIMYILIYRYNHMKSTIVTTVYSLEVGDNNSLSERLSEGVIHKLNEMNRTIPIKP